MTCFEAPRNAYLILIAIMAVIYGAYCQWLGYDGIVIGSIFGLLGTIAGYIVGKEGKKEEEPEEAG